MTTNESVALEQGSRTGWLYNLYVTSIAPEVADSSATDSLPKKRTATISDDQAGKDGTSALRLLFQDLEGQYFECSLAYHPYFLVATVDSHEHEVELGIFNIFANQGLVSVLQIEKEDLDMHNHLSGQKKPYLKLSFYSTQHLSNARAKISAMIAKNKSLGDANPFSLNNGLESGGGNVGGGGVVWGTMNAFSDLPSFKEEEMLDAWKEDIHSYTNEDNFGKGREYEAGGSAQSNWQSWVSEIREYDIKYHVRVAIDMEIHVGLWYDVTATHGKIHLHRCDDSKYPPAVPKICAFDIETTKAPLKFPQPEVDQIYMISYMIDGSGYLIVNREFVSEDIEFFEYTPKPEYKGVFNVFNEPDEFHLLRRFFNEMKKHKPVVYVTYNGDYFDFPFIYARSMFHGLSMKNEIGFAQGAEGATLSKEMLHLDCFYWVKRDSYLPQGSQGLKAVTKAKLGYDPIEVDPEDMLPLAQSNPQAMASYSISDAVSTYYLYMKYVHPFIFSLCTIIPMPPDEVLRKGSGTLCESLLCVQAHAKNVVFPNKQVSDPETFYKNHWIESETYIGGRVESLKSGIFRSDIPIRFKTNPEVFTMLINGVDDMLQYAIEEEQKSSMEEITNYEEVKGDIIKKLEYLREHSNIMERPLIYHLDVGAMYPNIILTNRLQPSSVVSEQTCSSCCFYTPGNKYKCQRPMNWIWRGTMFNANRYEYQRIKSQIETESFAEVMITKVNRSVVSKKNNYGNRKGNVLEGTPYEKKPWSGNKNGKNNDVSSGGGGYRSYLTAAQRKEERDAFIGGKGNKKGPHEDDNSDSEKGEDDDENGSKKFHKLAETTQLNMIKRRVAEYSRRAYGKTHSTREVMRTNVICQRENSFYVDTVRLFRDRRYVYKEGLKIWKKQLAKAQETSNATGIKEAQSRCVQMESLQLAHKCILNSFYGYVMRKGSRWYSMEMAGIVTYLGASLIKMARGLVQQLGVPLELDTDGIWCCLPAIFPENYTFTTNNGNKLGISYPCVMLNKDVHDRYTNHQYQELVDVGVYKMHDECSIYFEVDGPYRAMILPASKEENEGIKKRYAVFNFDGSLAELKGFELKRRGELQLIKDFQSHVFSKFLEGTTLIDAYSNAALVANTSLDLLYGKGEGYQEEQVLEKLTECSSMSRRLVEYPATQKSLALTTARRIAEFLGPQMVKDKGLLCSYVVSRQPLGRPVTERAIPTTIFRTEPAIRAHFLRKWTGEHWLFLDVSVKDILDWDYYIGRFQGTLQKIITIPAALQGITNPIPRVQHPDWLTRRINQMNSKFKQLSLVNMFRVHKQEEDRGTLIDIEDAANKSISGYNREGRKVHHHQKQLQRRRLNEDNGKDTSDSDGEEKRSSEISSSDNDEGDEEKLASADDSEAAVIDEHRRREHEERLILFESTYLRPKLTTPLDSSFFNDPMYSSWLLKTKVNWGHQFKVRKEILTSSTGNLCKAVDKVRNAGTNFTSSTSLSATLDKMLIDINNKALNSTWSILEVREICGRSDQVTVFCLLDKSLYSFVCNVNWTVTVDADPDAAPIVYSKPLTGAVLPRHWTPGMLYEVSLSSAPDAQRFLDELKCNREDIRRVYEGHLSSVVRFVLHTGATATVASDVHLSRHHKSMEFSMDELSIVPSSRYCSTLPPTAFVFHTTSGDTRGFLAAAYPSLKVVYVVCVQPMAAQRPSFNWAEMATEARAAIGDSADGAGMPWDLDMRLSVASDMTAGMHIINQSILSAREAVDGLKKPCLLIVQSALAMSQLVSSFPAMNQFPVLRILGAEEDEKLFIGNVLSWARSLAQRMLLRYFASNAWITERTSIAVVANVPLCNLDQDTKVSALDLMYMRSLKNHGHVLWDPRESHFVEETLEERPREVVNPTADHTWGVEFSVSQVEVVSVLFSQVIQENDDPTAVQLMESDIASHFFLLRNMLSELYSAAASKHEAAANLLLAFPRWIRDTDSACYEPSVLMHVSQLVHRALTALLIRIIKLGGTIVRATPEVILVGSNKHSLHDAMAFSIFILSSLVDNVMLNHLGLVPVRYGCPLVVLDHLDYCGFYVDAQGSTTVPGEGPSRGNDKGVSYTLNQLLAHRLPDPKFMQFEFDCTIWSRLTRPVQQLLATRLREFAALMAEVKLRTLTEVEADISTTLANKTERISKKFLLFLSNKMDGEWQMRIMEDVNNFLLHPEEKVVGNSEGGCSSTSVAAEYINILSQFLQLISDVEQTVLRIKNNCLCLCGIAPFSPSATFFPDYRDRSLYFHNCCSFCGDNCIVYAGTHSHQTDWKCSSCQTPFAKNAIEAHFVNELNKTVIAHLTQDFVCDKCKRVSSSLLCQNCCGNLVPKMNKVGRVIYSMAFVAKQHNMPYLLEAVQAAQLAV